MKIYYTFRTNKHIDRIHNSGDTLFIFGSLKKDLEKFFSLLLKSKVDTILGLAEIDGSTRIESVAVNQFGKSKKINKKGLDLYKMTIPANNKFRVSNSHTTSFCNWTMYKISEYVKNSKMTVDHSFVHFNKTDLEKVL